MKEQITFSQFCDRFRDMNRDNNFSYDGKRALFDYLENLEQDIGKEIDLDIIALCCEYSEYKDLNEYLKDYENQHEEKTEEETDEDFLNRIEEEINNKTTLIKFKDDLDEGFIISQY